MGGGKRKRNEQAWSTTVYRSWGRGGIQELIFKAYAALPRQTCRDCSIRQGPAQIRSTSDVVEQDSLRSVILIFMKAQALRRSEDMQGASE
jgi:hypothetical protein